MILEIFRCEAPGHRMDILERREGDNLGTLLREGAGRQDDAAHIFYHILFPDDPATVEKDRTLKSIFNNKTEEAKP